MIYGSTDKPTTNVQLGPQKAGTAWIVLLPDEAMALKRGEKLVKPTADVLGRANLTVHLDYGFRTPKLDWKHEDYRSTAAAFGGLCKCFVTARIPKKGPEHWEAEIRGLSFNMILGNHPTAQEAQDACARKLAELAREQLA